MLLQNQNKHENADPKSTQFIYTKTKCLGWPDGYRKGLSPEASPVQASIGTLEVPMAGKK